MNTKQEYQMNKIHNVAAALERLAQGKLILVRDDEGRENEGDLVGAASLASPEMVNFMVTHGRGLVCQPITEATAARLELPPQSSVNSESLGTAFTVSVDAVEGTTTGISVADRAATAVVIADPTSSAHALRRPGHVFPIVARPQGVFERLGHTEAAVDLTRLAGLEPSGLICEVLAEDGSAARGPELEQLSEEWDLPLISVRDIIAYRDAVGDIPLTASETADLPTEHGFFRITVFHTGDPGTQEGVILERTVPEGSVPLVRVHSECLTGEALHSSRCDCGAQLEAAMDQIAREGGALVYLRQEGRGIGLFEKIRAYALQDAGMDTLEANLALGHAGDARRFGSAAAILRERGYRSVRLMTNNPEKANALERAGITVTERIPLHVGRSEHNAGYLTTKFERMGHIAPREKEYSR
jgi:3,4-dihydroxy 2-butanone 4-phosphate synthase/GTP cyclohydrolase II